MDVDVSITMHASCEQNEVISADDIISLYYYPITWDPYKNIAEEQLGLSCVEAGSKFSDDDTYGLNADPIRSNICDVSSDLESETFLEYTNGNMQQSQMAMYLGSVTKDDFLCQLSQMMESAVTKG